MTLAVYEQDGWVINLSAWKMKQKRAFVKASNEIQETGDEGNLYPFYAQIVRKWPFAGDPTQEAAYDDLDLKEFQEVTNRVLEAFKSYLADGS